METKTASSTPIIWAYTKEFVLEKDIKAYYGENNAVERYPVPEATARKTQFWDCEGYDHWITPNIGI